MSEPTCQHCDRPYGEHAGCPPTTLRVLVKGQVKRLERHRYGSDAEGWAELGIEPPDHCRDCATALGELHHFDCDTEACPGCGGQLLGCPNCHYLLPSEPTPLLRQHAPTPIPPAA